MCKTERKFKLKRLTFDELEEEYDDTEFLNISKENAFDIINSLLKDNLPKEFSKQWLNLKIQSLINEHKISIKDLSDDKAIKYLSDKYWSRIIKILHDNENPLNSLNISPELNSFLKLIGNNFETKNEFSMLIDISKRKKKESPDISFFLIRFEEGTKINEVIISKCAKIMWTQLFIPVIGVEVNIKEKDKLFNIVNKLNGFLKIREVEKFHEYSFMEI